MGIKRFQLLFFMICFVMQHVCAGTAVTAQLQNIVSVTQALAASQKSITLSSPSSVTSTVVSSTISSATSPSVTVQLQNIVAVAQALVAAQENITPVSGAKHIKQGARVVKKVIPSSTVSVATPSLNPIFSLSFNANNTQQSDIIWNSGKSFAATSGTFVVSSVANLKNLYTQNGISTFSNQAGLAGMSVIVTDTSGVQLQFNCNAQLFNTTQMQALLQQGMYVSVAQIMQNNIPAVMLQLTDNTGTVYAQGVALTNVFGQVPTNFNLQSYTVNFNTFASNNANQTTKMSIGPVAINQVVKYQQSGPTPTLNFLALQEESLNTGNVNIANINPVIIQGSGVPTAYNTSTVNFASSITSISYQNLSNTTAYACTVPLTLVNVGVYDGVGSFIPFNFTVQNIANLQNLASLGLFVLVDLISAGQTGGPSINVYITDVNGTIYAQGSQMVSANITPTSYYVGFNTADNNSANGTTSIGVNAVPLGKVVWFQQLPTPIVQSSALPPSVLAPTLISVAIPATDGVCASGTGTCSFTGTPTAVTSSMSNQFKGSYYYGMRPSTEVGNTGKQTIISNVFPLTNINFGFTDGVNGYYAINFDQTILNQSNIAALLAQGGAGMYVLINSVLFGTNQETITVQLVDSSGNVLAQKSGTVTGNPTQVNIGFNMMDTLVAPTAANQGYMNGYDWTLGQSLFIQNVVPVQSVAKVITTKTTTQTYQLPAANMYCAPGGTCQFSGTASVVTTTLNAKPYQGVYNYSVLNGTTLQNVSAGNTGGTTVVSNVFPLTNINFGFTDGVNGFYAINFDQTALSQGTIPTLLASGGAGLYVLVNLTPIANTNNTTITVQLADSFGNVQAQATGQVSGAPSLLNIGFNMNDTAVPFTAANQGYINNIAVQAGQPIFIQNTVSKISTPVIPIVPSVPVKPTPVAVPLVNVGTVVAKESVQPSSQVASNIGFVANAKNIVAPVVTPATPVTVAIPATDGVCASGTGTCNFTGTPTAVTSSMSNQFKGSYYYGMRPSTQVGNTGKQTIISNVFPLTNINFGFTDGVNGYYAINFDQTILNQSNIATLLAQGGAGMYVLINSVLFGTNQETITVQLVDSSGNVLAQKSGTVAGNPTQVNIGFNMMDTLVAPTAANQGYMNGYDWTLGQSLFIQNVVPVQPVEKIIATTTTSQTYQLPAANMYCAPGSTCQFSGIPITVTSSLSSKMYTGNYYYGNQIPTSTGTVIQAVEAGNTGGTTVVSNVFPLTNINVGFTDGVNGFYAINFDTTALSQNNLPTLLAAGGKGIYILVNSTPIVGTNNATVQVQLVDPSGNVQAQASAQMSGYPSLVNIGFNMSNTLQPMTVANQGYINDLALQGWMPIFIQNTASVTEKVVPAVSTLAQKSTPTPVSNVPSYTPPTTSINSESFGWGE